MVAGHAGNCKQGCTASSQPAIAEELHLLGSEEDLETAVPNLEVAAWVETVDMMMRAKRRQVVLKFPNLEDVRRKLKFEKVGLIVKEEQKPKNEKL